MLNKSFLQYGLIFLKKEPMKDHKKFENVKNKFDAHFSENLKIKNDKEEKIKS